MKSLIYRTLFYVDIYGSYKTVRFFGPPCISPLLFPILNVTANHQRRHATILHMAQILNAFKPKLGKINLISVCDHTMQW